jgi:hypothetical protein
MTRAGQLRLKKIVEISKTAKTPNKEGDTRP